MEGSSKRPVVYVELNNEKIIAPFDRCLLDIFCAEENSCSVEYICEKNGDIILKKGAGESSALKLYHSCTCPLKILSVEERAKITDSQQMLNVGATVFLRSKDDHVLLIRRSKNLRLFPGLWVLPGGHTEAGETFLEAGLREFYEETGISVTADDYERAEEMFLFESCYPPFKEHGLPKGHHIIAIYFIQSKYDMKTLDEQVKLCTREVDASVWLSKTIISNIVHGDWENNIPEVRQRNIAEGKITFSTLNPIVLSPKYKKESANDIVEITTSDFMERLSTSTHLALEIITERNL